MSESDYLRLRRAQKNGTAPKQEPKDPKPIAKKSAKRKVEDKVYKKIVAEFFLISKFCEVLSPICTKIAQGLNHKRKRSPKTWLDKENLERCCNACQTYIEENPDWAVEHGHAVSRFQK